MTSFAVAGPFIWNSLSAALRTATLSPLTFAWHLKAVPVRLIDSASEDHLWCALQIYWSSCNLQDKTNRYHDRLKCIHLTICKTFRGCASFTVRASPDSDSDGFSLSSRSCYWSIKRVRWLCFGHVPSSLSTASASFYSPVRSKSD